MNKMESVSETKDLARSSAQELTPPLISLLAPLSGPLVPLEGVPDPVFSAKVVGPGIAIDPTSSVLLAPCAGQVVQLHRAGHAVTLQTDSGQQILLHVGIDTVKLGGEGFRSLVKVGSRVQAGQELIAFDADLVAKKAKSLITVMIALEAAAEQIQLLNPLTMKCAIAGKDELVRLSPVPSSLGKSPKAGASAATEQAVRNSEWAQSPEILIQHLPTGLHARPAALLVNVAKRFRAEIQLIKNGRQSGPSGNAKSVVAILALEINHGDTVHVCAEGAEAHSAAQAVYEFLKDLRETKTIESPSGVRKISNQVPASAKTLLGVGVSPGIAIGRTLRLRQHQYAFSENSILSPEQEEELINRALSLATDDLKKTMSRVQTKSDAAIFSAHIELLQDPDILASVRQLLVQGKTAAFAWSQATNEQAEKLAKLHNELLANRANDVRDVGHRVLKYLVADDSLPSGASALAPAIEEGTILLAENLTPSETVQIDRSKVVGFCTTSGGATSHVAILARSLGLPAIAGIDGKALQLSDGTEVVLDGEQGALFLEPSSEQRQGAEKQQTELRLAREEALKRSHQEAITRDGHTVEVAANIGSVEDAKQAVSLGADGVGLLRSEFLFLDRETAPSEEEQLQVYQEIANVLGTRTLVIRTLDVGGDKPLRYLPLESEENPFLGIRGIRVGFLYPEVLREQLRAILRVKSSGRLCVMFPMISSIEEFRAAKAILEEEKARIGAEARKDLQVGIMVEVPSVALAADAFAREADFFSVGTNDLTQYTLAMDRGHTNLAKQVDALHPSVLRLIQLAADAAHRHGKWIGVCGGLASDTKAVGVLVGLGVDELSVSVPAIALVKSAVRGSEFKAAKDLAALCVVRENAADVRRLLDSQAQT